MEGDSSSSSDSQQPQQPPRRRLVKAASLIKRERDAAAAAAPHQQPVAKNSRKDESSSGKLPRPSVPAPPAPTVHRRPELSSPGARSTPAGGAGGGSKHLHSEESRIQQAKRAALVRASSMGATGNYKSFDSPFGNYLVPVLPLHVATPKPPGVKL